MSCWLWELVGFNEWIAMGELVNKVLAMGELVAFDGQTTVLTAIWGGG